MLLPPLAVVVPLLAGVVIILALAGLALWHRTYRVRDEPPPPELRDDDVPGPPPDRDATWDPRERHGGT